MNELVKRALALALYRRWFYAPHFTGRRAIARLTALGWTWDGACWAHPQREVFVQRITQ